MQSMPITRRPERAARSYVNEYAPENNQSGTPDRGANQSASHDHSRHAPFAKAASSGTIGGRSKPARARRNRARLGKNRRDIELARSAGPCPLSAIRDSCAEALAAFAVGTRVTPRPPHRSVRAAFPHTAPTSGIDGRTLPYASQHPVTRLSGSESSACFVGPHSPWSLPFAPPTPLRITPLCSSASQLL